MYNITKHYNIKQAGGFFVQEKWREIKNTIKYRCTKNKRFHD